MTEPSNALVRPTARPRHAIPVVLLLALLTGLLLAARPAAAAAGTDTLATGETLTVGQRLVSPSGQYTLTVQTDGNLVLSGNGCALWASNTAGSGTADHLTMQTDGNLVLYTASGAAVWSSKTSGSGPADHATLQDDANFVVYTAGGTAPWASGGGNGDVLCQGGNLVAGQYLHSENGKYRLAVQSDGNVVLTRVSDNTALWTTNTAGSGATDRLTLQTDGNLVLYNTAGTALWSSKTSGAGAGCRFFVTETGLVEILTSRTAIAWYA
jgi:hypothetical protein